METLCKRGLSGLFALTSAGLFMGYAGCAEPQMVTRAQPQTTQPASPNHASAAVSASGPGEPQQMLYYVCGNPGIETHATSPDSAHPFNLGVTFVSAANGAPLSDVSVKVRRHGRVLMDFTAAGPHCLFAVPEADYRIEGTYHGEMKFEIVQTGTLNAQIKW
jgi:hypothetical protein